MLAVLGALDNYFVPFTWGKDPAGAVYLAMVLDTIAQMDMNTLLLNPEAICLG